jgi:hypothetical protein
MLDGLPFPKTRSGVLAAVVLTILLFVAYYWFGFSQLLKVYENHFQNVPYVEGGCSGLSTHIRIPKWVYSNGVQWVYISVENRSGYEVRDIVVQFFAPMGKSREGLFLLPSFFDENLFNDFISIESLQNGVTLSGRLLIPTRDGFKLNDTQLKITCNGESGFKRPSPAIQIRRSQLGAFLHSTLENVLLPPWSNGIIPAFIILSCWLFEDKNIKDDHNMVQASEILAIILKGLAFNSALWIIFGLGVQSPSAFLWVAFFVIVFIFVFYIFEKQKSV